MARLPKIPNEIKNQIYYTLSQFGCARWKALLIYAEALSMCSDDIPEDIRNEKAEWVAYKALTSLLEDGRLTRTEVGDERVITPQGSKDVSYIDIYAFDAFAALVHEIAKQDKLPELCYPGKTENSYPFHYIFTSGKQELLYRVIVYGQDAFSRIGFLNSTYNPKINKGNVTLLVVPEAYSWEEIKDVSIRGSVRTAIISKGNRKNRTYKCTLTDISEEEDR